MLLLASTSDKIQVVTDTAANVDVHASYADYNGTVVSVDRKNTAIASATTTDVVTSPGSGVFRNVKTLIIRNRHASLSVLIVVKHTDGTTVAELESCTLAPGEELIFAEGIGWVTRLNPTTTGTKLNSSTADQSIGASATAYLTGSALVLPPSAYLKVGTILRWTVVLAKTAAATATETIAIRFGVNGTTGDTARNSFTGDTETAVADEAVDTITAIIRGPIGASCVVEAAWMRNDNLTTTGFSNTARKAQVRLVTSAAFDITPAGTIAGLSIATGASHALTIRQVIAEMLTP